MKIKIGSYWNDKKNGGAFQLNFIPGITLYVDEYCTALVFDWLWFWAELTLRDTYPKA